MMTIFLSRRNFSASLLGLSLVTISYLKNAMNSSVPPEIFKRWMHSREEDTQEMRIYRPSNYPFPPSRGREGFEMKENGEFISYGPGPTDRAQKRLGTWKLESGNRIVVTFEDPRWKPYTMEIIFCDREILKVRWH